MSTKISPTTNLQQLNVLNDFAAPKLTIAVPMPNFDLRTAEEFQNVPTKIPFPLTKDIKSVIHPHATMPAKHPAFAVVLMHLIPKFFAEMTPIDWGWHKEVLRRARVRDEAHRIMQRVEIEDVAQHLHDINLDQKVADLRVFYFERARLKAFKATESIKMSNAHAKEEMAKIREHAIDVRDERAAKEFVRKLMLTFSPTIRTLQTFVKRARTEPTLAEIRIKQDQELTPLELVLQIAYKEFPLIRREQINDTFKKFANQINQIEMRSERVAVYRLSIQNIFRRTYLNAHSSAEIAKDFDTAQHFKLQDYHKFIQNRSDDTTRRTADRLENYLDHLAHNESMFQKVNEQVKRTRAFKDHIAFEHIAAVKRHDKLEKFFPVLIEGQTEFVQFNPSKFQTQYGIIKRWIDNLQQQSHRTDQLLNDRVAMQATHNKKQSELLNEHTLRDAREADRMREATMVRDYFRHFDLRDTMTAFVSLQKQQDEELKQVMLRPHQAHQPKAANAYEHAVNPVSEAQSFKKIV